MIADLRRLLRGSVSHADGTLRSFSTDFGGTIERIPSAVVRPIDAEDVVQMVRYAASRSIPLAVRGAGLSQGGQSLSGGGIVLDTSALDVVALDPDGSSFIGGSGTTWKTVVRASLDRERLPPVRTFTLLPTVGGTLSVGGVGSSSFRRGLQVDSCMEIELVTGSGERARCTPDLNPELFHWTLGGLGQLGIIVSAQLALHPCLPWTRTWSIAHDTLSGVLGDLQLLAERGMADYLEGTVRHAGGRRVHSIQVAREIQGPGGIEGFEAIAGVSGRLSSFGTISTRRFALAGSGLGGSTEAPWAGRSEEAHPWLYGFLPWSTAGVFLDEALDALPDVAATLLVLYPVSHSRRHPMIPTPHETSFLGCGLLATVARRSLQPVLEAMERIDARLSQFGGSRYAGDYLHFSPDRWCAHLGPASDELQRLKKLYDPAGIVNRHIQPRAFPKA